MFKPEAKQFLKAVAPFNQLSRDDFGRVVDSLTPAQYAAGETIQARRSTPGSLFVVADGIVE